MEHIILLAFITVFVLLCAYSFQSQRAIIEIVQSISNQQGNNDLTDLQDIITPKSQFVRNILLYILMIGLFIQGIMLYEWYWALSILVISLCIISPLLGSIMPKPDNPCYLSSITKNLEKRLLAYKANGYASKARQDYIENILVKLKEMYPADPQCHISDAKRFSTN